MAALAGLQELVSKEGVEFVDLRVVDLAGRWRHVTIPAERLDDALVADGVAFDGSNLGYAGVDGSDLVLKPDLSTATMTSLGDERLLAMICDIYCPHGEGPFVDDPRAVARRAEAFALSETAADAVRMSPEFEFYVFRDATYGGGVCDSGFHIESLNAHAERSFYHACPPEDALFDLRNAICRKLREWGLPVRYHHHEGGAHGQQEIEVGFMDLVAAADATMIVKSAVRCLAAEAGYSATFLPKPLAGQNGSGLHVHQWLEQDGRSLFDDEGALSDRALCYIGGMLVHGRSLCALTNPSTNSYRRLVPGYEAPVWFAYGEANRSAAIRVPRYAAAAERRIELRTADATCNPYLAYAAMVMAGVDGILRRRHAVDLGLGPFNCDLYALPAEEAASLQPAPRDLEEALACLEQDHDFLLVGDVFSRGLIASWIECRRRDIGSVRQRPHPHEFSLYYDL